MLIQPLNLSEREFRFRKKEFDYLARLIKSRAGINLAENKQNMVYSRLVSRLRELQLRSFEEYCALLEGPQGKGEMGQLINAVTTNLTRFFREPHHFEHLGSVMSQKFKIAPKGTRIRIWSAGCSSGQEPYSIAMTMAEDLPQLYRFDFRILATDLDTNMVATGAGGRYGERDAEGLSPARRDHWAENVRGSADLVMKQTLRQMIVFKQLNLHEPWPMRGKFDAIFCRNVMIYFDAPTRQRLIERFHASLIPDGWLYIGHSETIIDQQNLFKAAGKTIYRRVS